MPIYWTQPELHDFTERAVRYCSNLGDNVDRASENPMFIGGNAIVYRGTLCPEGVAVAVKTVRFQGKSDMRVIMVSGVLDVSRLS